MDRFIDVEPSILSLDRFYLKSNMDRFIVQVCRYNQFRYNNLKSNMDRFIEVSAIMLLQSNKDLKSNMDRFIGKGR